MTDEKFYCSLCAKSFSKKCFDNHQNTKNHLKRLATKQELKLRPLRDFCENHEEIIAYHKFYDSNKWRFCITQHCKNPISTEEPLHVVRCKKCKNKDFNIFYYFNFMSILHMNNDLESIDSNSYDEVD